MFIEELLQTVLDQQEKILKQQDEILSALGGVQEERLTIPKFAEREGIGYGAARNMINKRILPSPVHIVQNGADKVNWPLYCEWLKNPENAKKLEKL